MVSYQCLHFLCLNDDGKTESEWNEMEEFINNVQVYHIHILFLGKLGDE